jgi:hypothetical protein
LSALAVDEISERDLRTTRLEFGRRLMTIYKTPMLVGVYRCIVTEGQRFPELAIAVYEKGPGRAGARLTEVLEIARSKGEIETADCEMAADHFVGMIRDNLHLKVVLGLRPAPSPEEAKAAVVSAVNILLHGMASPTARRKRGQPAAA